MAFKFYFVMTRMMNLSEEEHPRAGSPSPEIIPTHPSPFPEKLVSIFSFSEFFCAGRTQVLKRAEVRPIGLLIG